jgi:hypothetical protein
MIEKKTKQTLLSAIGSIALFWILISHHLSQQKLGLNLYTHLSNGVDADSDTIALIQNDIAIGFIKTAAFTVIMSLFIAWSLKHSILQSCKKIMFPSP